MELQDAGANLRIIQRILRMPFASNKLMDFDECELEELVTDKNCFVLILGYETLRRLQSNPEYELNFQQYHRETDYTRFVVGKLYNKLVMTCYSVPKDAFIAVMQTQNSNTASAINVIL